MERIYLDNAATTRVRPEVAEAVLPAMTETYGNASSVHSFGREAKKAMEKARAQVAAAIGAKKEEIYFTAGGSEADNWAIKGAAHALRRKGLHIITTAIEHHAVLHTCQALEKEGFEVTYLPVDEYGLVTPEQVEAAIRPDTILVSVMAANNEIGTIEPIAEIGAVCRAHKVLFHTDAVQAVGHMPLDVAAMQIDMLSLSGHKFYAPKGVGALYIRTGVRIENLIEGGAQERNRRAGTENVPAIVGMGKAIELITAEMAEEHARISGLRDRLIAPQRAPDKAAAGQCQRLHPLHRGRGAPALAGHGGHRGLLGLGVHLRVSGPLARAAGHRPAARDRARLAAPDDRPRQHAGRDRPRARGAAQDRFAPARHVPPVRRPDALSAAFPPLQKREQRRLDSCIRKK